ncbi:DUF1538 domain-containing protein [Candidatus Darwinibacter acetoxidans]|nr:DUF1538 domain-containing protein [Bacillota bacterium]
MNALVGLLKDNVKTVIPIAAVVLVLNFTLVPLGFSLIARFLVGAVLIIIGLSLFLLGVDIGITPMGSLTGSSLVMTNKLPVVLLGGLVLGFFISIAEPGLMVLAYQVDFVTLSAISSWMLLIVVSTGLAIMVSLGFLRVVVRMSLKLFLLLSYLVIFVLALFTQPEFLAIAFDSSGATTGILAVPFLLALAVGISRLRKDSVASEEDSFGLVAIASAGAIMSVLVLNIIIGTQEYAVASLEAIEVGNTAILKPFWDFIPTAFQESFVSLLPLTVSLFVLQKILFHLERRQFARLVKGFLYAFIGMIVFFVGVYGGFMEVAGEIGLRLAMLENKVWVVVTAFALGFFTILAEPAVYVLTHTIEDVTSGYVKRKAVGAALSIGVGSAVALAMIRILTPAMELWHILLPSYIIAVGMMYYAPNLFVGIAFDAGGVATGPMTATFILAFVQGAASAFPGANLLRDGFGMIALVATAPIITLQILGFIFQARSKKQGVDTGAEG